MILQVLALSSKREGQTAIQVIDCIFVAGDYYPTFKAYQKDGTTFLYDHSWSNPTIYNEKR